MSLLARAGVRPGDMVRLSGLPTSSSAPGRLLRHAVLLLVACALLLTGSMQAGAARSDDHRRGGTRVKRLAAKGEGKRVKISGWATFSGQILAARKDPKNDGAATAEPAGAEIIRSDFTYRPENEDFFFRLEVTKIPSLGVGVGGISSAGDPNTLYGLIFTAKNVPYEIRAHKIGDTDTAGPAEPAFGLFKCTEAACIEVASLKGGYGTTGERIVVALPLEVLHDDGTKIQEGDQIGDLRAYTAIGQFLVGPAPNGLLDDVRLIKAASVEVPKKSITVTVGRKSIRTKLEDGHFSATFPARLFRSSPTTVTTKTCLGKRCRTQAFQVRT